MDLLQEVADGTFKVETIKDPETGTYEQRLLVELPPEEAFESFAARVRPFTISDEPVNWALVLDAVEGLTPRETLDEVINIEELRVAWAGVTQGKTTPQAYSVITANGQLTDLELADQWLNSQLLHAQVIKSIVGNDLDLDERYQAAAGVYARLGACVNITYNVVKYLFDEGLLNLNKDVFTEPVIARTSVDIPLTAGYSAPAGSTPMPTDLVEPSDLDDEAWTPMYQVFEQIIEARKENEAKETGRQSAPRPGSTGGVQIRWPYTPVDSWDDMHQAFLWSR